MERTYLICGLVGFFCAENNSLDAIDLKIKIDQALESAGFPLIGSEKNDTLLLDEFAAELLMSIMGRGYNRTQRREKH